MQGKRVADQIWELKPGEYSRHRVIGSNGENKPDMWVCMTPNGNTGTIVTHTVVVHEDGTITVTPSILLNTSYDGGKTWIQLWHGYLEHGIWREC
jgi:photosystem II stability/assembly factor-like uncharacterized protein